MLRLLASVGLLSVSLAMCSTAEERQEAEPDLPPAVQTVSDADFDGAEWIRAVTDMPPWRTVSDEHLEALREAAPAVAECAYGEDESQVEPGEGLPGGGAEALALDGGVVVLADCPYPTGTGAYGLHMSMAFVSDGGARPVSFMMIDGETRDQTDLGLTTMAWLDDRALEQGTFTLFYKYAGHGGCGQLVSYRLDTADGLPGFSAHEIREQADCAAGDLGEPQTWPVVWTSE